MYLKTLRVKLIFIIALACVIGACGDTAPASVKEIKATDSLANSAEIRRLSADIEQQPENAELYYRRATAYYNLKYLDRALIDIADAIKFDQNNPLYQFQKGRICYAMNKTIDAERAYLSAIALKNDYEAAQMKLAELYYLVKKHKESLDLLNNVIAKNSGKYDAWFFKGMNYKETGDTGKAVAAFQRALESDPNYYEAAIQLGIIFTAIKNKSAYDYLTAAINMQKKNSEGYFLRAYYFQQAGAYQKALLDYRRVIDLDPSSDMAYYNVGVINYDVKQYDEALRAFNICKEMNNNNVPAYYMSGLVHEIKGNKLDARLNYEYALKLDPGYELARERLNALKP